VKLEGETRKNNSWNLRPLEFSFQNCYSAYMFRSVTSSSRNIIQRFQSTMASKVVTVAPDAKLTPEVIRVIKATAPVVAEHVEQITSTFYKNMFHNNPEVLKYFNQTHQKDGLQQRALADAVVAYALNIDNLGVLGDAVARIAHRHVALAILPAQYPVVHDNLMLSVGQVLGDAVTPEIANAWSQSVLVLANICVDAEEKLYEKVASRAGGWRGEMPLVLVSKKEVAQGVVQLNFKRQDYDGPFEFDAGQYLTLRCADVSAPRHYTVTCPPGSTTFQITTRKIGEMTAYLHDKMQVGDVISATAPCGVFLPNAEATKNVLISAGIGATPMWAMLQSLGAPKVVGLYHVEHNEARHALKAEYANSGVADSKVIYTETSGGRPNLDTDMKELVAKHGTDATYYICAPTPFIQDAEAALKSCGANDVRSEMFGTGTVAAKKCPMH